MVVAGSAPTSMAHLQQAQSEGACLRYPDPLPTQRELSYENAASLLLRGSNMAMTVPFSWSFVDKPSDGTILLLYLPPGSPYPIDGIRFLEAEVKYTIPLGQREIEVYEAKYGYIPNHSIDSNASRLRRRYRITKGGNPQLVLAHYTRGPQTAVAPAMLTQPVRNYPLRQVSEPPVYVAGEKAGQKVYPPGAQLHAVPGPPPATIGIGMSYTQQQAMLQQQNNTMEALERRRERERHQERVAQRDPTGGARPPASRVVEEEESGDEIDQISTRTLALARYKRNHDWMNDVFHQAAFGKKSTEPTPTPYSIFSLSEVQDKTAKLQAELDILQAKADQRRADKIRASQTNTEDDISINVMGEPMVA